MPSLDMPVNALRRSTFIFLMFVMFSGYPATSFFFGPKTAIEIANIAVFVFSIGIVMAYGPIVKDSLRRPWVTGSDILVVGIFISWASEAWARGGSILWRFLGQPAEWLTSTLWGLHIALSCVAALAHIIAPKASSGRVSAQQWGRIFSLAALGALLVVAILMAIDPLRFRR